MSLPRSRSAWLAHFLRYGGKRIGHDTLVECSSISEFTNAFASGMLDGSCETGAMLGWQLIRKDMPGARIVVVRRDLQAVGKSLQAAGLPPDWPELERRSAMLDLCSRQEGVVSVEYEDLNSPIACQQLFEHCLELPFDWEHWARFSAVNIQVNMQQRVDRLYERHQALEALKADVRARLVERRLGWPGLH